MRTQRLLTTGLVAAAMALAVPALAKNTMSTPTLSCAAATETSVTVAVCAGPTGAPAGFSVQWMTAEAYAANSNQWYLSEDPRLCKASLSGVPGGSNYNLAPNECINVQLGDNLFDDLGASSNCANQPLLCGTDYVIRAFAHANSSLMRSAYSANQTCSTLPCSNVPNGCTLTQGYWKQHNDSVCLSNPDSPLCVNWPVTSLTLGTVTYTESQLLAIFNTTPAGGNGLVSLAHQLIAAKLNIAAGADGSAVASTIAAADALIGGLVIPSIGTGFLPTSTTSNLTTALDAYNQGLTGPGHCQ